MQCFFLGLKICGSKINTTMCVNKSLFTLTTGMILRAVMSSSACQQLQASSATADPELINWGQEQSEGLEKCQVNQEEKIRRRSCAEVRFKPRGVLWSSGWQDGL